MNKQTIPDRENPDLLQALLEDCKSSFAQLLVLMEQSLSADPQEEASQALAFENQIQEGMRLTNERLKIFVEYLEPWDIRRKIFPSQHVDSVEQFFDLLEKGLGGLQNQINFRSEDIKQRRALIRENLEKLNQRRQGLKGYKHKGNEPGLLEDKA